MDLQLDQADWALAGGVSLAAGHWGWVALCALHALSPCGRCKTFDADADGYGRGDLCCLLFLANSERSSSTQLRGQAVNQDGRSASFMAPNGMLHTAKQSSDRRFAGPAQRHVIEQAWGSSGTSHQDLTRIEAHGTGTALGDPIEVGALRAVLRDSVQQELCVVGTMKSRVGHTEFASGITALLRWLLSPCY